MRRSIRALELTFSTCHFDTEGDDAVIAHLVLYLGLKANIVQESSMGRSVVAYTESLCSLLRRSRFFNSGLKYPTNLTSSGHSKPRMLS